MTTVGAWPSLLSAPRRRRRGSGSGGTESGALDVWRVALRGGTTADDEDVLGAGSDPPPGGRFRFN